jgi:hypothetical protein
MPAARVLLLAAITVLSIGAAASPPAPQPVPQTHGARETPDATGDRGPGKQRLPATGASQTPAPDAIGSKSGSQGRADDPTADGWMRKATFWSAIANIAIALVALIGLGLTRQAANAATKSADASVRSADIARQALVDVQRAYMFVKSFQVDHIQEQGRVAKWRIVTQWENYGQTPAVDVRMASVPPKIPSEQTQEFEFPTAAAFSDAADAPTAPIAPQGGIDSNPIYITVAEAEDLRKGNLTMVIGSRVQYRDIFTDTQRHTEICARIVIDPEMVGKPHPFRFPAYPKYNSHS